MPTVEPAIEILLPDGRAERPERRRMTTFRPYSSLDGCSPGSPAIAADRRRRRRALADYALGRRLDLVS